MSDEIEHEEKSDAGRFEKACETSIQSLMQSYEGRWFLSHLLDSSNLLQQRYLLDGDVHAAIWRDGRASMAATLLQFIEEHAPDQYGRLIRERRKRLERERTRSAKRSETFDPFNP